MADTRNQTIDALKGAAILAVMAGHVLVWNHMEDGYIYDAIKVIQMPLFLMVSGYLCGIGRRARDWDGYVRMIKKRAVSYLVPFFFWIILLHPLHPLSSIAGTLFCLDKGLWFLMTLFLLNLMIYTAQLAGAGAGRYEKAVFWAVFLLLSGFVVLETFLGWEFLSPGLTRLYLPFYLTGYLAGVHWERLKRIPAGWRAGVFVPALCGFVWLTAACDLLDVGSPVLLGRQLTASFLGCYAAVYLITRLQNGRIKSFLAWLGGYTLEIYVLHFHFATLLNQGKQYTLYSAEGLLFALASFAVMSAVTVAIIAVTKRIPLLDFLLYGKAHHFPDRRAMCLLMLSYGFCAAFGVTCLFVLLASTIATYFGGIFICGQRGDREKKLCLGAVIFLHVLFLSFFKYNRLHILLPVGISFYTFQAIGYLTDIYRGNTEPERNFIRFALFQAFFPKLVQGPIERSGNLLEQIRNMDKIRLFDRERIREGGLLVLWGLFQKVMIADRIAVPVNAVYTQFGAFGGVEILLVTVLYAFQIYCDFAGYTCIARGAARICGFELLENFRQPYFADSVQDFWRRWHMSLSGWLRDYVYIPLGGGRRGRARKYINIMLTFLVSGIWHGTGVHFLLWGLMHGAAQIADIRRFRWPVWLKRLLVFCFVDVSWMVFRVNSLGDLKGMLGILLTDFRVRDFAGMELTGFEWGLVFAGILLIIFVDAVRERGVCLTNWFFGRPWVLRCLLYTGMFAGIIILGVYGAAYDSSGFLYTRF